MSVLEKINDYLEKRADYDEKHEASSQAHKLMKAAERDAVDTMLDEGVPSMGLDTGIHISLRKHFGISVTEGNDEAIRQWLVESQGDDSQFVVERVHKPALTDWLKQRIDALEIQEDDVPEFLKLNTRPGLTVRGWKTRKEESK